MSSPKAVNAPTRRGLLLAVPAVAAAFKETPMLDAETRTTTAPKGRHAGRHLPGIPAGSGAKFAVEVCDDSVNRALNDGDFAICAPCKGETVAPNTLVFIERERDGLVEYSIRRVAARTDGHIVATFWSTDSRFTEEITIPSKRIGERITIKGRVVGRFTPLDEENEGVPFWDALARFEASAARLTAPEVVATDEALDAAQDECARASLALLSIPARGVDQARALLAIGYRCICGDNYEASPIPKPVTVSEDLLHDAEARHAAFLDAALRALR